MRQWVGRTSDLGSAKKPRQPRELKAMSQVRHDDPSDMSLGCVSTPSSASRPTKRG
jgi:hypothetical protein